MLKEVCQHTVSVSGCVPLPLTLPLLDVLLLDLVK